MRRWQLTEHVSYPRDGITMLWPLSWADYNWRRMFYTLGINNHVLSVVMRRWKLTEYVSYLRCITMIWSLSWDDDDWWSMFHTWGVSTCSDRYHETMTTDGATFIHVGYIIKLLPLSWDDDNWRSMFHTLGINNHGLSVVMRWWQRTDYISYLRDI